MKNFSRIDRLPPYTLGIVNELKHKARQRGEDIIDFGLGNPDQPTPKHIVEKLCEAAVKMEITDTLYRGEFINYAWLSPIGIKVDLMLNSTRNLRP